MQVVLAKQVGGNHRGMTQRMEKNTGDVRDAYRNLIDI
jgi:hypothetical protein